MPNDTICKKDHSAIVNILGELNQSQAVIRGRHRCAGCAYEDGYAAGVKAAGGDPDKIKSPKTH